jgi:hypothetical protein
VYETATFVVILDSATSSIALRRLDATAFDFGSSVSQATVAQWLAMSGTDAAMP